MTTRLLAAVACVGLSLLCVWIADPDTRNAAFVAKGALWGVAGVLVVWVVQSFLSRRHSARDHDLAR